MLIKFWIINIPTKTLVHEREFPVNLMKAKKFNFNGDLSNAKLKDKVNFVNSIFTALGFENQTNQQDKKSNDTDWENWENSLQTEQLEYYDFSTDNKLPVIELHLDESYSIWPLIIIEQNKNLFCGLPLIFNDSKHLIDHLNISVSFATLKSIINFYSKEVKSNLELFISNYLPFGQLISFPAELSKNSLTSLTTKNKKQEAIIFLKIIEFISSSNPDKELIYGTVVVENNKSLGDNCKMLVNIQDLDQLNLVLSPYCKKIHRGKTNDREQSSLQIRLNQAGSKLIHYLCEDKIFKPFIVYDYTITRSSTQKLQYKIDLQINVNIAINLSFAYFNVIFSNCFTEKTALVLNSTPNWGQLSLEKNGLTWFIGNKLPKSLILKISLDVTCDRSDLSFGDANLSFQTDNFNYAFPKLTMDNLQILNSNQKTKLLTELSFQTVNYKLVPNLE